MAIFKIENSDYLEINSNGGKPIRVIRKEKYESFNESILGLGEIDTKANNVNAMSVVFDLEGFTNFCKQIDPHLAVPEYLSEFLKWLFQQVRKEIIDETFEEGYRTYTNLPFLSKFMGDGILFLWDTDNLSEDEIMNIVLSMYEICTAYRDEFYPLISKRIVSPPLTLRCGIARGSIYSVGNGNDYVGPCINMAARLQKLNSLTFSFSRRGLNPEVNEFYSSKFMTKKVNIRGIGTDELVCVLKSEFENLPINEQEKFTDV